MSIKVVCGCGFCTQVPSNWKGKRVKCKCGRSFTVGQAGAVTDPPVPSAQEDRLPPTSTPATLPPKSAPPATPQVVPPVTATDGGATDEGATGAVVAQPTASVRQAPDSVSSSPAGADPTVASPPAMPTVVEHGPSHGLEAHRHHHRSSSRGPLLFLAGCLILAISSVSATYYFTQIRPWSQLSWGDAADNDRSGEDGSAAQLANDEDGSVKEKTTARGTADKEASRSRLANLIELVAEDGLLLTGLFGTQYQQLDLSDQQQQEIAKFVEQLTQNEEELRTRAIELEQWYAAVRTIGTELLGLLEDQQKERLQRLIERQEAERVHLVDYSARVRPELSVAEVPWSTKPDRGTFRTPEECTFSAGVQYGWRIPVWPSGMLATINPSSASESDRLLEVWNLAEDQRLSSCELPGLGAAPGGLLSRDGRYLAVVAPDASGVASVAVWETESGTLVGNQTIPHAEEGESKPLYTIREIVAHRVFGFSGGGYWVWDFDKGETHEFSFAETVPDASTAFAITAGGKYLALAHSHRYVREPETYCFVEVCLYHLDTGELLGNRLLERDYRQSEVSAMAFSRDGRELAVLWDFGPEEPTRSLVHMHATNGKIIRTVHGLPAAEQGYAHQHGIPERDLFWLPRNSGWVVNLEKVVDGETGAILELERPSLEQASPPGPNDPERIVEAIPADGGRLMLIIARGNPDAGEPIALRTTFVKLPKLGPFM